MSGLVIFLSPKDTFMVVLEVETLGPASGSQLSSSSNPAAFSKISTVLVGGSGEATVEAARDGISGI